jgi:dihydrofolate synthase / folylpolyglutamate synthase
LQRLKGGALSSILDDRSELWLDGGHNADAGVVLAESLSAMPKKPLVIIWGMLNTKDATQFFRPLAKLADHVVALSIPNEPNAISAEQLAETVQGLGTSASTAIDVINAVRQASLLKPAARILICGSLYLAGHVLAAEQQTEMSAVTGVARR